MDLRGLTLFSPTSATILTGVALGSVVLSASPASSSSSSSVEMVLKLSVVLAFRGAGENEMMLALSQLNWKRGRRSWMNGVWNPVKVGRRLRMTVENGAPCRLRIMAVLVVGPAVSLP